jgi:competence protein ComEC
VPSHTPQATTVFKSPHHGSKTSSSEMFLEAVQPQLMGISEEADNRLGHPSPEVLERSAGHGFVVFRTDEHGMVEFRTDGGRLWVETDR